VWADVDGFGRDFAAQDRLEVIGKTFRKNSFVALTQCFKTPPLVPSFIVTLEFVRVQAGHVPSFNSDQK
jgi:hypothetical protein